ncbi:MAG: glycosyltransferase [Zhengella sp.]|uniref:glycosyltransferase n=1 Tax=Zhengella sp. TaxID=2282762 RepID=UPI001E19A362|nr:glycosyltransferase [Notoacmeibacter sp.]MCC0028657.1 glycosyltransferase [Brucellaceae bacterium]
MILHYLDARYVGGIETHVETIVAAQRAEGLDARILLHAVYSESPAHARFRAAGLPIAVAADFVGLCRLLRIMRPDMVHTHGYKAGILGRIAARLVHVPVVSTFHAGERARGAVGVYQWIDEKTAFLGGRLAVSRDIACALPWSATVIRNFVNPAARPRTEPATPVFLFAGRLSREKGPDLFLKLANMRARSGEWRLLGDGPMREELVLSLNSPAVLEGFAINITPWLERTTALVMTSRKEGLPMAALEAMGLGVPVIAPAVGALPDLVRHGVNGYLYPPGDMEEAAACIDRLMASGPAARSAMGEAAIATIRAAYSPQTAMPAIFAAYRRAGYRPHPAV